MTAPKKNFEVHESSNGKFYVIGQMGEGKMALPLTKKSLAKQVAHDLNKQLDEYRKDFEENQEKALQE